MGLTADEVSFLLWAKRHGADFSKVAMLGRQSFQEMNANTLRSVLAASGIKKSMPEAQALLVEQKNYTEPLLRLLGAKEIDSIDASSYEGATHVLDMNRPVPDHLKEKFTVVMDSGTLEHIFDFPTAIRNCMELIQIGGHFLGVIPCNNYLGHGFYQFSPELFFRIFSEENGFRVDKMFLFESPSFSKWYEVMDPEKLGRRAELRTWRRTHFAIQARKTAAKPLFRATPQQSDYATAWHLNGVDSSHSANSEVSSAHRNGSSLHRKIIKPLKPFILRLLELAKQKANAGSLKQVQMPERKQSEGGLPRE